MSGLLAAVSLAVMCVSPQAAPPAVPDFTGHWIMIAPAELAALPGQEQRVRQDAETITVSGAAEGGLSFVYRLDGTETTFNAGGVTGTVRARWEGEKLRIVTVAGGRTSTSIWSMDAERRLTIESSLDEPAMSMTMVFRRK